MSGGDDAGTGGDAAGGDEGSEGSEGGDVGEGGEGYGDRLTPPGAAGEDGAGAGAAPDGDLAAGEDPRAASAGDSGPGRRTRLRRRFGLGEQGWLLVETLALVAPYPLFVWVLLSTDVPELPFLLATVVYSVLATTFGFRTLGEFLD